MLLIWCNVQISHFYLVFILWTGTKGGAFCTPIKYHLGLASLLDLDGTVMPQCLFLGYN